MLRWGFKFPKTWPKRTISYFDQKKYELVKKIRYYKYKKKKTDIF